MKQIYFYDIQTGSLTGSQQVGDAVVLEVGMTDIPLPPDLVNPKFDVKNNAWTGTNLNDWLKAQQSSYQELLKAHPELIPDDQKQQELLMHQSQQITLLQSTVMQQNQANAKFQATNQQQKKQIEQLQQLFMQANQQEAIAKSKEEAQQ